jgi:hypothetical protein
MKLKRQREIERLSWKCEMTRGNHYRLTHPDSRTVLFTGVTPSDHRADKRLHAQMRRALRTEEKH